MNKNQSLTFYKSELAQYNYILQNSDIKIIVADFLLKYVSIESFYKKLLIADKESRGAKLTEKDKKKLSVQASDVKRILNYYEINFDDALIERIFGSKDNNYMDCSVKKLRDRMVHRVNENVLRVVIERYDNMINDLNLFIELFEF